MKPQKKKITSLFGVLNAPDNMVAAAQEDTIRLDWMDEHEAEIQKYGESEDGPAHYEVWFFVNGDPSPIFSAPTLRQAIDLARNSSKRKSLKH